MLLLPLELALALVYSYIHEIGRRCCIDAIVPLLARSTSVWQPWLATAPAAVPGTVTPLTLVFNVFRRDLWTVNTPWARS